MSYFDGPFYQEDEGDKYENESVASSSSSDEESNPSDTDEEDFNPPVLSEEVGSLASLIAINQAYLDVIDRLSKRIDVALKHNREKRERAEYLLRNSNALNPVRPRIIKSAFNPPYFKDPCGMVPPQNVESIAIRSECTVDVLMNESRQWSSDELSRLKAAVLEQAIELKTQEMDQRRERLREKIVNYHAEDGIDELNKWRGELISVERRLNYLRNLPEEQLLAKTVYEQIDWARISASEFHGVRTIVQLRMKWMNEQAPQWNKEPWTEEEIKKLNELASSFLNWDLIAERLRTNRTAYMCFEKWTVLQKQGREKKTWTQIEDEKLLSVMEAYKNGSQVNWAKVAAHMPNRSAQQCANRFQRSLDPSKKHGRWTEAEDMLLMAAVNKFGPQDWGRVAEAVPGRHAVQCRARWIDVLDYKRNSNPWSIDDDEAILMGLKIFGRPNYSKIAKLISGRNGNDVKCRVRTLLRWKISAMVEEEPGDTKPMIPKPQKKKIKPIQRFNEVMKISNDLNRKGLHLAQRMGLGTFVTSEDGEKIMDYSVLKEKLEQKFGFYTVKRSGTWLKYKKNPNEFGEEELTAEAQNLSEEKRQMLKEYLVERSRREQARRREKDCLSIDEALMDKISMMMNDCLDVTQRDVENYHMNAQRVPLRRKRLGIMGDVTTKTRKKRNRPSARSRITADFSSLIADMNPKRYTIHDRITDEICFRVNSLPPEKRRVFILRLMAESVGLTMEAEARDKAADIPREVFERRITDYAFDRIVGDGMTSYTRITGNQSGQPTQRINVTQVLSHLIPPSTATCNSLLFYVENLRSELLKEAATLFPPASSDFSTTGRVSESEDDILDIRLSKDILSHPNYLAIKQRMFRLYFFPMLLKKAFESDSPARRRQEMRKSNSSRRLMMNDILDRIGITVRNGVYVDTKAPKAVMKRHFSEPDPNPKVLSIINHGFPAQMFFNPLASKRIEELEKSLPKERKPRAAAIWSHLSDEPVPSDINEMSLSQFMTTTMGGHRAKVLVGGVPIGDIAVKPKKRSYQPRWALNAIGTMRVGHISREQASSLTVAQLMLLKEEERARIAELLAQPNPNQPGTSTGSAHQ